MVEESVYSPPRSFLENDVVNDDAALRRNLLRDEADGGQVLQHVRQTFAILDPLLLVKIFELQLVGVEAAGEAEREAELFAVGDVDAVVFGDQLGLHRR